MHTNSRSLLLSRRRSTATGRRTTAAAAGTAGTASSTAAATCTAATASTAATTGSTGGNPLRGRRRILRRSTGRNRIQRHVHVAFDASRFGLLITGGPFVPRVWILRQIAGEVRLHLPGSSERNRIFDGRFVADGVGIHHRKSFHHVSGVAVHRTHCVPPTRSLAGGIDNQRVAFPFADRIGLIQFHVCRNVLTVVEVDETRGAHRIPCEC